MHTMQANCEAVTIARQALSDTPSYLAHIEGLFNSCADQLRVGQDQRALNQLARAADDLDQFSRLVGGLAALAGEEAAQRAAVFSGALLKALSQIERSLMDNDLVTLSDQIEDELIPLFPGWSEVQEGLSEGLEAQAVEA